MMRTHFDEQLELLHRELITILRTISSALKMVTDLERIGDHAVNVAGWVLFAITGVREREAD